jgi:AraC-like DNA-binding protein
MDRHGNYLYKSDMPQECIRCRVNTAGIDRSLPGACWDSHAFTRRDYDLWIALKGRAVLKAPHGPYDLFSGGCFILRPWERYVFESNVPSSPAVVVWIHYDYLDAKGNAVSPASANAPPFFRHLEDIEFIDGLLQRVLVSHQSRESGNCSADLWLAAVLAEISRQDEKKRSKALPARARAFEALCEEISEHPGSSYRVHALARRFHCTADHFSRLFKEAVGRTPSQYVLRARLNAARKLLRATDESVGRIAGLLGYDDVYFFSRQFHQKTGVTPSQYRKRQRRGQTIDGH